MNNIRKVIFVIGSLTFFLSNCTSSHREDEFSKLLPEFIKDSVYFHPENSYSKEKAELGRYLFYDRRLSINNTKACASCHAQDFSFTDSYNRSIGVLGDLLQRNSKPLINIVFEKYLTAADSTIHFPEQQMNNPMFNEHPVELGIKGNEKTIQKRIKEDEYYSKQFKKVFPEDNEPVNIKNIQYSIASFVKTILSFNSPYDNYYFKKNTRAITIEQYRGMQLFLSSTLNCTSCHGGINFSTPSIINEQWKPESYFNIGLYNTDGKGSYPASDIGLASLTKNAIDMGKYKVPTLRNLAFTAPYFHDGSAATLEEALAVHENGGRNVLTGPDKGDGRNNPHKYPLLRGFKLNSQERKDMVSFLLSLSDSSLLKNPAYANPFSHDETK